MLRSHSFIAIPPGVTIKEKLHDRGLNQKEFAIRMNMSEKHISRLINGEVQLTQDVARRLELVLGMPAKFWNNLEAIYREKLIKVKNENEMEADKELVKKLPYNEMSKNGWVPETRNIIEKVSNLRKFFEVVSLDIIKDMQLSKIACRRLAETEKSNLALLAWAQKAKIEARKVETSPINLEILKKKLPDIRSMTTMDPADFDPRLKEVLASCGIALVFLPHIGGSFLHGATFCDTNKIVVGLTVRGKYADKFWFSLFHELGHILLDHVKKLNGTSDEDENAADKFAKEMLISNEDFNQFISQNDFSKESICNFANEKNILPGIIVGRLQKEKYIDYTCHNELKIKYKLSV